MFLFSNYYVMSSHPVSFGESGDEEKFVKFSPSLMKANKKLISSEASQRDKKKAFKEIENTIEDLIEVEKLPERKKFDYLLTSMHAVHGVVEGEENGWIDTELADNYIEDVKNRLGENWKEGLTIFQKFHGNHVENIVKRTNYEVDPEITFKPDEISTISFSESKDNDFRPIQEVSMLMNEAEGYLRKHQEENPRGDYDGRYRHEYFGKVEEMLEKFFSIDELYEKDFESALVTAMSLANHIRKAEELGGVEKDSAFDYIESVKQKIGEDKWKQEVEEA